jgi:hypothetical protein
MVDYALASEGAGELIDRDAYIQRHWPDNGALNEVYKHCGCTTMNKCSTHDDYSTYKFLLSDPLATQSDIVTYKQEQERGNRSDNIGNYLLYNELLERYPHYALRGSAKTGDTFYRQKGARFNFVPPYRVCANELYHQQKQWTLKQWPSEIKHRPLSAPSMPPVYNDKRTSNVFGHEYLPTLPTRRISTSHPTAARSYQRSNYFYDMAL